MSTGMDKSETEQDSQMHKNQMQKKNALPENFEKNQTFQILFL